MSKAVLSYMFNKQTVDNVNTDRANSDIEELILLSGSLRQIDNFTRNYSNVESIRLSKEYQDKINDYLRRYSLQPTDIAGRFVVYYIMDSDKREYLPIFLNDDRPIRTHTSALEETKSEVEQTRKLLFSSKDKLFIRSMLRDERFGDTTGVDIKLNLPEYREVIRKGFKPRLIDGTYYLSIEDVLKYASIVDKYGMMRGLIEDTLEVWKNNLLSINDDLLYYYSRHFRICINEYHKHKLAKKMVTNLKNDVPNLIYMVRDGGGKLTHYPIGRNGQYLRRKTKKIEEFASIS